MSEKIDEVTQKMLWRFSTIHEEIRNKGYDTSVGTISKEKLQGAINVPISGGSANIPKDCIDVILKNKAEIGDVLVILNSLIVQFFVKREVAEQ